MGKQYEIGSSSDGTYVYAQAFSVPYTMKLALTLADELLLLGEKLGVQGCLIDIRGVASASSVTDKYQFAYEKTKIAGLPHHWRFAFLKDHDDDSPDFIETVMINAGFMFQIFEDEHEAIGWLKGAPSR